MVIRSIALILLLYPAGKLALAQEPSRVVHVFVALADNQHQGIAPVPAKLGNGDDPDQNLYWGSAYGVRTFFSRSRDWKLLAVRRNPGAAVLERCVFEHRTRSVYLVADAYRGSQIRQAIVDFLRSAAGANQEQISVQAGSRLTLGAGGSALLVAYVGHDGLMDFQLSDLPRRRGDTHRQAIILACLSKAYFSEPLRVAGAHPLIWTTGLMAPEAYTLKSALDGWILGESDERIRERAAAAYHQYQRCGLTAARRLLATGW
jgi:hypothetical protein